MSTTDKLAGLTQTQLDAHWMPFSGNRDFKKNPRIIVSGKGSYYTSADGRKIFDGLSGLWTCGAGHSRPEIVEAVSKQIKQLDYAPGFQFVPRVQYFFIRSGRLRNHQLYSELWPLDSVT